MSGKKGRRQRSAAEKLRIVLAGQDGGTKLSELCRREGIAPSQYHQWKKQLQAGASAAFEKKASVAEEQSAAEIQRLKNVIAEITAENLELKKGRWA
jgi:transposase